MQAAHLPDQQIAGTHMQVIGIGKLHLCPDSLRSCVETAPLMAATVPTFIKPGSVSHHVPCAVLPVWPALPVSGDGNVLVSYFYKLSISSSRQIPFSFITAAASFPTHTGNATASYSMPVMYSFPLDGAG